MLKGLFQILQWGYTYMQRRLISIDYAWNVAEQNKLKSFLSLKTERKLKHTGLLFLQSISTLVSYHIDDPAIKNTMKWVSQ